MDSAIAANRAHWNKESGVYQATHDPAIGAAPKLWGVHAISEETLEALGRTVGLSVLELGCGAGQWTSSLAVEGTDIIGLDLSESQLAAACHRGADLRLVQAAAEHLPFADQSFDVVFCDHGAMSWADPAFTLPEVRRVLCIGGRLVFNVASPMIEMCWDEQIGGVGVSLRADYFGTYRCTQTDGATYYTPGYGDWIKLFRAHGFVVDALIEPRPTGVEANTYWNSDPPDWFKRWPGEILWVTHRES